MLHPRLARFRRRLDAGDVLFPRVAQQVAPGERVAQGPYTAETIPVTIEEQYVVVEM